MLKLAVIAVVAERASTNHRFFRMHSIDGYKKGKAPNLSEPGEFIYFVPDVSMHNAWYNSHCNGTHHLGVRVHGNVYRFIFAECWQWSSR